MAPATVNTKKVQELTDMLEENLWKHSLMDLNQVVTQIIQDINDKGYITTIKELKPKAEYCIGSQQALSVLEKLSEISPNDADLSEIVQRLGTILPIIKIGETFCSLIDSLATISSGTNFANGDQMSGASMQALKDRWSTNKNVLLFFKILSIYNRDWQPSMTYPEAQKIFEDFADKSRPLLNTRSGFEIDNEGTTHQPLEAPSQAQDTQELLGAQDESSGSNNP